MLEHVVWRVNGAALYPIDKLWNSALRYITVSDAHMLVLNRLQHNREHHIFTIFH